MGRTWLTGALAALFCGLSAAAQAQTLSLELVGRYTTGLTSESSGETAALRDKRLYVTNAQDVSLDIVDVSNPAAPTLKTRVDLKAWGSSANSVDVSRDNLVAVAIDAFKKTDPGTVVFLDRHGKVVGHAKVGAGPDMVVFTPQGERLLVANEGEPDCYGPGCTDPEGSVSVIDVKHLKQGMTVHTIGFANVSIPAGVRIFGPGASAAQDLEPEYITVSADGRTAWVTLQENNAIARLDLRTLSVADIFPLGYKDHGLDGNALDASDRDGLNIRPYAGLLGMYQPDAVAQYRVRGKTWLVTANEGDARDYPGFAEEVRASGTEFSRLTVTNTPPDGDTANRYVFGARSFSIRDALTGMLVWDSGDEFERRLAELLPQNFNSNNDGNNFDNRSDNKGPEPEAVAVGRVADRTYAFVGLERVGGVMVYDITDPFAPAFERYFATRDFSTAVVGPDSGPEVIRFLDRKTSPTRKPMLVISNEITGTVNLVNLDSSRKGREQDEDDDDDHGHGGGRDHGKGHGRDHDRR